MLWTAYTVQGAGVLLALWGLTVFIRAAMHRRRIGKRTGTSRAVAQPSVPSSRLKRHIPMPRLIGLAGAFAGIATWVVGTALSYWLRGEDFVSSVGGPRGWPAGAAIGIIVIAFSLVYVGWRFHPARGRRHCPKCLYNCDQLVSPTCPECGFRAPQWSAFERDLREPRLIRAGLLLLPFAWVALRGPLALREHTWMPFVPTTVLIAGWKYLPDSMINSSAGRGSTLVDRLWPNPDWNTWKWQIEWLEHYALQEVDDPENLYTLELGHLLVGMRYVQNGPVSENALLVILRSFSQDPTLSLGPMMQSYIMIDPSRWNAGPEAINRFPRVTDMLSKNPTLARQLLHTDTKVSMLLAGYVGLAAAADDACRDVLAAEFHSTDVNTRGMEFALQCGLTQRRSFELWLREQITKGRGPRKNAAILLYEALVNNDAAIDDAVSTWVDDPDPDAAVNAALMLMSEPHHSINSPKLINRFLADPASNTPLIPYFARVRPTDQRLIMPLIEFIARQENDEALRAEACQVLGHFGATANAALATLDAAAAETTPLVSEAALEAISAIRGEGIPRESR